MLIISSTSPKQFRNDRVGDDMKEGKNEISSNVIQFPNLKKTLAEKGTLALKNKEHEQALTYFDQLLSVEPEHAQANIGKAICLVELGNLQDAADVCEVMLNEAIGDYFEVLQIYVSILMQLEQYNTALELLEAVLQEEKLPPSQAEFFYQILSFCRKMVSEGNEKNVLSHEEIDHYTNLLHSEHMEKQMIAIKNLTKKPNEHMLNALKKYLRDEKNDPLLKSVIIKNLAEEKINEPFEVHKFSQRALINPAYVQDVFADPLAQSVNEMLSDVIENKNPTLYEMSLQLWTHVLMSLYPIPLPLFERNVLAAAIHYESSRLNGLTEEIEEICTLYSVNLEDVKNCIVELAKIIKGSI